jgi:DNA-binding MarR family transcriptional regulator
MSDKQLLTVREQEFYEFWRKLRNPKPIKAEMARRFGVDRQRVQQLMDRLKKKNWIVEAKSNGRE